MNPTISRDQVEFEARAKIMWGEERQSVLVFLRVNGVSQEEATELIEIFSQERKASIRGAGIKQIAVGCALISIPVIAWFIFQHIGVLSVKLFAITCVAGVFGGWKLVEGILKFAFPESEKGDVSE